MAMPAAASPDSLFKEDLSDEDVPVLRAPVATAGDVVAELLE